MERLRRGSEAVRGHPDGGHLVERRRAGRHQRRLQRRTRAGRRRDDSTSPRAPAPRGASTPSAPTAAGSGRCASLATCPRTPPSAPTEPCTPRPRLRFCTPRAWWPSIRCREPCAGRPTPATTWRTPRHWRPMERRTSPARASMPSAPRARSRDTPSCGQRLSASGSGPRPGRQRVRVYRRAHRLVHRSGTTRWSVNVGSPTGVSGSLAMGTDGSILVPPTGEFNATALEALIRRPAFPAGPPPSEAT